MFGSLLLTAPHSTESADRIAAPSPMLTQATNEVDMMLFFCLHRAMYLVDIETTAAAHNSAFGARNSNVFHSHRHLLAARTARFGVPYACD